MLQYVFAGLALGAIYAVASAGLVITYVSSGVVNFAFGSMAFFVARFYYWLHSEQGVGIGVSAVLALLVLAPTMGAVLYVLVFRHLSKRTPLVRLVATIGLSVALPPLAVIVFGNTPIPQAPGLAPRPLRVFHVFGAPVNADQMIVYGLVVVILLAGTAALRFTDVGLQVRALVDSEALTAMSGVSPARVSLGVWVISATLAGTVGVLVAPIQGLTVAGMTLLMASAFAALVAARLRSLPAAVAIAVSIGLVTDVIQKFLPADSEWAKNLVPGIPFLFIVVFLCAQRARTGRVGEQAAGAGALDHAIEVPADLDGDRRGPQARAWSARLAVLLVVLVAVLPLLFHDLWLNLLAQGLALAVALLSITVATGEGGMIWLCQITFAGGGAAAAAELAAHHGFPSPAAASIGALAMVPIGLVLGALTIRFGDVHVALVTLGFGLLVDVLVFPRDRLYQNGLGVEIARPGFAEGDRAFAYLCLVVFGLLAVVVLNLRRSTVGLAMNAVRSSEPAARTLGVRVVRVKLVVAAVSTFVAGLGGALLAMWNGSSQTDSFHAFQGLIWLAVLVTIGLRSIAAALIAGLAFTMLGNVFTSYLPTSPIWLQVPALLFGLGAIGVAADPDGVVLRLARRIPSLAARPVAPRLRAGANS